MFVQPYTKEKSTCMYLVSRKKTASVGEEKKEREREVESKGFHRKFIASQIKSFTFWKRLALDFSDYFDIQFSFLTLNGN